jgi:hypothetical protein
MRISDLFSLAVKNLRGAWAVLPAAAAAISAFCLCFAGTALTAVQQEKSQPYELSITVQDDTLSENDIAEVSKLTDVVAVTPLLEVSANVIAGEYSAELTLTGINPVYLTEEFEQGGVFPESSVMPYIVLNEAACKLFKSQKDDTEYEFDIGDETETESEDKAPDVDWLNESVKIQTGEGKPVTSKICGILPGEGKDVEPIAYISVSAAKELLKSSKPVAGFEKANARITNSGCAESVTKGISALGFSVGNIDEGVQQKWDGQEGQITYLLVIGVFCLLCTSVLIASMRKISLLEQQGEWQMLRWLGMREKDIGRIFVFQTLTITAAGTFIGIVVSTSLPSFLDPDPTGTSIYTLQAPFWVAAVNAAVCIVAGLLPLLNVRKSINAYLN